MRAEGEYDMVPRSAHIETHRRRYCPIASSYLVLFIRMVVTRSRFLRPLILFCGGSSYPLWQFTLNARRYRKQKTKGGRHPLVHVTKRVFHFCCCSTGAEYIHGRLQTEEHLHARFLRHARHVCNAS